MSIKVKRYTAEQKATWDGVVSNARNGLFLFARSYMDYHGDRFEDHSLLLIKDEKVIGLFPANESGTDIWSHAGLTFGGVISSEILKGADMIQALAVIISYYQALGFKELFYKAIPAIYHSYPCQEDLYALFRHNAILYRRDLSSVVDLAQPLRFSESKRQAIVKSKKAGLEVKASTDFVSYWNILTEVLSKFDAKPVHSVEEITALKTNFPANIHLYVAVLNDVILAGAVIYDYGKVVHTQYMANSKEGRAMGALDYINAFLIEKYSDRSFFSFGTSTENRGRALNEGLLQQKEMMGGRAIVNDFYKIEL